MIASFTVGLAPIPTLFPITTMVRELDPAAWPAPHLIERYRRELAAIDVSREGQGAITIARLES